MTAAELLAGALPICCAFTVAIPEAGSVRLLPGLHVDTEGRPDARDLAPMLRSEGAVAHVEAGWEFFTTGADRGALEGVFTFEMTRPARCSFKAAVEAAHRPLLAAVAKAGHLALMTAWPCPRPADMNGTPWGIVACDTRAIRTALAQDTGHRG